MLSIQGLTVRFGRLAAVEDVSLEVAAGEVVCLLGPSGCGKSTLLRAVAGLEETATGVIALGGRDLAGRRPDQRGAGLMFQDGALFPHRDVRGNVAFGLRMQDRGREDIDRRVSDVLALVGLSGTGDRPVARLSGGEQQRVALARAIAPEPQLLMLDEPLGSLDRALRDRLLADLPTLFERLGSTVLYVTHDQDEALAVADRVAVMRAGRIVQVAAPDQLWRRPADEFVARFLGQHNLVDAEVRDGVASTAVGRFPVPVTADGPARLLLLPDGVSLDGGGLGGVVSRRRFAGDHVVVTVRLDAGPELDVAVWGPEAPAVGDRAGVRIDPDGTWPLETTG